MKSSTDLLWETHYSASSCWFTTSVGTPMFFFGSQINMNIMESIIPGNGKAKLITLSWLEPTIYTKNMFRNLKIVHWASFVSQLVTWIRLINRIGFNISIPLARQSNAAVQRRNELPTNYMLLHTACQCGIVRIHTARPKGTYTQALSALYKLSFWVVYTSECLWSCFHLHSV